MGGTPWDKRDVYLRNSPLFDFEKITAPVLIAHGTKDGLSMPTGYSVFCAQTIGKKAEYLIYKNEDTRSAGAKMLRTFGEALSIPGN